MLKNQLTIIFNRPRENKPLDNSNFISFPFRVRVNGVVLLFHYWVIVSLLCEMNSQLC